MAKKRAGGGSNLGLIISLVLFVLLSLILAITTYMGFSEQADKEAKLKDFTQKAKLFEDEKNFYRFQSQAYRAFMGHPVAGDKDQAAQLARDYQGFLQNPSAGIGAGGNDAARTDVKATFEKLAATMPWTKDAPDKTYEDRLKERDNEIAALKTKIAQDEKTLVSVRADLAKERQLLEESQKENDKKYADLKTKVEEDIKKDYYLKAKVEVAKEVAAERKLISELREKADVSSKLATDLEKKSNKVQGELVATKRDLRDVRDELERTRNSLALLAEQTGRDSRNLEVATFDNQAAKLLKAWNKDWKIVELDKRGNLVYLNLGSADGLQPQVTFSVHSVAPDGRLSETSKATVEVVKVIDPRMSLARVTSLKDGKVNPILKGDRLYNPTWDPARRRQVAIAGLADLGGDGGDNADDLRRLLSKQNVDLVAYIDTKDEKEPKILGPGISPRTDYLILGDGMDGTLHPKARDKDYATKFDKKVRELKEKAAENGVQIISLRKYLELIGYRAPKVITTTPGR